MTATAITTPLKLINTLEAKLNQIYVDSDIEVSITKGDYWSYVTVRITLPNGNYHAISSRQVRRITSAVTNDFIKYIERCINGSC